MGGRSRAWDWSANPTVLCEPSQKGLLAECPQRQSDSAVRPPRPKAFPLASTISNSPSTRSGPFGVGVIFVLGIAAESSGVISTSCPSVLGNRGIHLIRPRQDPALQVRNLAEAGLAQKRHGVGGALAAAAVCHDLARGVQFVDAPGQLAHRDQVAADLADLRLVRLADVEDEN